MSSKWTYSGRLSGLQLLRRFYAVGVMFALNCTLDSQVDLEQRCQTPVLEGSGTAESRLIQPTHFNSLAN